MSRTARLRVALGLNICLVFLQLVCGFLAHSVGLWSDAGHNLTDVAAVVISLTAVRYASRAPTESHSYGYHRGTILAALANSVAILSATLVIVYAAIRRLQHPMPVRGGIVVGVALVAFVINAGAGLALHEHGDHGGRRRDLNMRSAVLHMAGDALASLGVAMAGLVILVTGRFNWLDPAVSLGIAVLIALEAVRLVKQATDVLLESTPGDVNLRELSSVMVEVDGVDAVHDLHVWSLSSEIRALSAHLVLTGHPTLEEAQVVGDRVKREIGPSFAITHATLELECEACSDLPGDSCAMDAPSLGASVGRLHNRGDHDH